MACVLGSLLASASPLLTLAQQAQAPAAPGATTGALPTAPAQTGDRVVADPAPDPALELRSKRDQVSAELQAIASSMKLSEEKAAELQKSIEDLEKTSESLKTALIESASRRKDIEKQISEGEKRLADIGLREDEIRASFRERRAMLAEVLAALQRMGRNPRPLCSSAPKTPWDRSAPQSCSVPSCPGSATRPTSLPPISKS